VKQHKAKRGHSVSVPASQGMENLIDRVASNKKKPSWTGKKCRDEDKAMQPVKHITDNSALGWAFKHINQGSDDDAPDDKSPLDSLSDPSESESSESLDDDDSLLNSDAKTKKWRKHSKKSKLRSLLKSIPPEKYNGAADLQSFYKFMNDEMSYLKQGRVPSNKRVDILSHYLSGRAYNFYTQEVSIRTKKWNLVTFFKGLFNHCFLIDFWNKQRHRLDNFVQGNKSIRDYVSKLTELFTIVGTPGKCEQVTKLWYGFQKAIQKALYTAKLNPETSR